MDIGICSVCEMEGDYADIVKHFNNEHMDAQELETQSLQEQDENDTMAGKLMAT